MNSKMLSTPLQPKLMSFDVFGTLISVRDSSYSAFERILADAGALHLDVKAFWEQLGTSEYCALLGPVSLVPGDLRTLARRDVCVFSLWWATAGGSIVTRKPSRASFFTTMSSAFLIDCRAITDWLWCPTSMMTFWS